VPELEGCHTQAKTLDELQERVEEAVELYSEVEAEEMEEAEDRCCACDCFKGGAKGAYS